MEESNSSQHTKQTWRFRREQAQADINRLLGYLKKYEDVRCQIRFLQRCNRSRLIPKGLRSTLSSLQNSQSSNDRFCRRIHFRLLRSCRTIRNKYHLLSEIDNNIKIYSWNLKCFNLGSNFYQCIQLQIYVRLKFQQLKMEAHSQCVLITLKHILIS